MKKTYEIVLSPVYVGQIVTTAGINDGYDYSLCLRYMNDEGEYDYVDDVPDFIFLQNVELIEEKKHEAFKASAKDDIVIGHINIDFED